MKKLLSLAALALLILLVVNCKKEEEFTLIGTWNIDAASQKLKDGAMVVIDKSESNIGQIKFEDAGTGVLAKNGQTPKVFTWSLSGTALTIDSAAIYGLSPNGQDIYTMSENDLTHIGLTNSQTFNTTYKQDIVLSLSKN